MKNKNQFILAFYLLCFLQPATAAEQHYKDSTNSSYKQSHMLSLKLSVKPRECVVFKEGDKCYANIHVKWKASEPASFCLHRTLGNVKLECWQDVDEGSFSEDLVMSEPVIYYLVRSNTSEVLVKETLNLSWVYKKSTRPEHTWRLF